LLPQAAAADPLLWRHRRLSNEPLDQNVQSLAFAETLQPLDCFAPMAEAGVLDRRGVRLADRGDREFFAASDLLEQSG